jgi:hypothetical protein
MEKQVIEGNMSKKVYCINCEHYDPWNGEEKSCWKNERYPGVNPIYPPDEHKHYTGPGNPYILNKNNDCKDFEPRMDE